MTAAANFLDDWGAILEDQLKRRGVKIKPGKGHQEISFAYWNVVRRYIEPHARTVRLADSFSCPAGDQAGLDELRDAFEKGWDVNPYLSNAARDADDPNFNDRLLNDWDVHHFHLGGKAKSGVVNRSRNVLAARVTDKYADFIAVIDHDASNLPPGAPPPWVRTSLIETMHRNWADALKDWRSDGWTVDDEPHTDNDIEFLRGKAATKKKPLRTSFTYLMKLQDETVYHQIGGGSQTTGLSTTVIAVSNWYSSRIASLEDHVLTNAAKIVEAIKKGGGTPGEPPHFTFHLNQDYEVIVTERAEPGIAVFIEPLIPKGVQVERFTWTP